MENSVTLMVGRLSSLYNVTDLHALVSIGGRLCADGSEAQLKPGDLMWWKVNNIKPGAGLEIILEGISEVCNTNGDVVSGRNVNNNTE